MRPLLKLPISYYSAFAAFALLGSSAFADSSTANNAAAIEALRLHLSALGKTVRPDEAQRVAACAYRSAGELRRDYRVVGPPLFHNFLVLTGIRQRGLCYQWAEDLFLRLNPLKLTTLELHWGTAYSNTLREHNCIVVTANHQPFGEGIVLDCWRHGGKLYTGRVATDHYPWIEDMVFIQAAHLKPAPSKPAPASESRNANTAKNSSATAPAL